MKTLWEVSLGPPLSTKNHNRRQDQGFLDVVQEQEDQLSKDQEEDRVQDQDK